MMIADQLLQLAKEINAISEIGLVYRKDEFDEERYNRLKKISLEMMSLITSQKIEAIANYLQPTGHYITPMVDVRAVIFNENDDILLVKEKSDGLWAMPGGWADVGYTPAEIAVKETEEEAGLIVEADRLLAIMDKKCHDHPADIHYVYKICILCKVVTEGKERGHETEDAGFFSMETIPPLSNPRNTVNQVELLYNLFKDPNKMPYLD